MQQLQELELKFAYIFCTFTAIGYLFIQFEPEKF